jgi:hypothetical protein
MNRDLDDVRPPYLQPVPLAVLKAACRMSLHPYYILGAGNLTEKNVHPPSGQRTNSSRKWPSAYTHAGRP